MAVAVAVAVSFISAADGAWHVGSSNSSVLAASDLGAGLACGLGGAHRGHAANDSHDGVVTQ